MREFYESTIGRPAAIDKKFEVFENVEIWVYPRGVATINPVSKNVIAAEKRQ